ncbi:hypothetical protein AAMO2058_000918700 [Amorphochlora amoebiformis]
MTVTVGHCRLLPTVFKIFRTKSRKRAASMGFGHLLPTFTATTLQALSGVCCDACLEEIEPSASPHSPQASPPCRVKNFPNENSRAPVAQTGSKSICTPVPDSVDSEEDTKSHDLLLLNDVSAARDGERTAGSATPCDITVEVEASEAGTCWDGAGVKRVTIREYMGLMGWISGFSAALCVYYLQSQHPRVDITRWLLGEPFSSTSDYSENGGGETQHWKTILAILAGIVYFLSFLLETKAFETESSTVITPLLQLSAVWMVPISTTLSLLGLDDSVIIKPWHLLSIVLITVGGLLPAAQGDLSKFASRDFWYSPAVLYCITGELGVCIYDLILHEVTYKNVRGVSQRNDKNPSDGEIQEVFRFFVLSRLGNALSALVYIVAFPPQRSPPLAFIPVDMQSPGDKSQTILVDSIEEGRIESGQIDTSTWSGYKHMVRNVDVCEVAWAWRMQIVAMIGLCMVQGALFTVMTSYSIYYEPSVINALEGGMQQLSNLILAFFFFQLCNFGRAVDGIGIKLVSFVMIVGGIWLSTV